MRIEIWSDFTCPFCYIGKKKLEMALGEFAHRQYIHIEFKSYQLDPQANSHSNENINTMLMKKYGLPNDKIEEMNSQIKGQAKEVDLAINFENMKHTNTFNAHRLVKYAQREGKEGKLVDLLFEKYFNHNENIGDRDVLLSVAVEAGLDKNEAESLLCLNRFGKAVETDEQIAKEIGINGVPFFIFDEQYAVSGAQPVHVFMNVLEEIWNDSKDRLEVKESAAQCEKSYCEGNDCE